MKGRKKVGILLQYSEDEGVSNLNDQIKKAFQQEKRKILMNKSIRVLEWNMKVGHNNDDFVNNTFSVVFTGFGYKVPRIIKNMLLK